MQLNKLYASNKAIEHAKETSQINWTGPYIFAVGRHYLRILFKFERGTAPGLDPFIDYLGKFLVSLQVLDDIKRFS